MPNDLEKNRQKFSSLLQGLILTLLVIVLLLTMVLFFEHHRERSMIQSSSVRLQLPSAATTASTSSAASRSTVAHTVSSLASPESAPTGSTPVPTAAATPNDSLPKKSVALPGTDCLQSGWYAQLGAFATAQMASSLAAKAQRAGFPVCIGNLANNHLYRVLVGPQPNRDAASAIVNKVNAAKIDKAQAYPQYWTSPQ